MPTRKIIKIDESKCNGCGLGAVIRQALAACGKAHIPYKEEIISIQGA